MPKDKKIAANLGRVPAEYRSRWDEAAKASKPPTSFRLWAIWALNKVADEQLDQRRKS